MSLITIEDVNGLLFDNQDFFFHEINTALIDTENDFTDVKYDFCKVTRVNDELDNTLYDYTIKIDNSMFTLGYYVYTEDDTLITTHGLAPNNVLQLEHIPYSNIKVFLYLGIEKFSTTTEMPSILLESKIQYTRGYHDNIYDFHCKALSTGTEFIERASVTEGLSQFYSIGFYFANIKKSDFEFNCNQELIVGTINTVKLGVGNTFYPTSTLIQSDVPTITAVYNETEIPVTWNGILHDYCFDLDLSDVTDESTVKIKIIVDGNKVINHEEFIVLLSAKYPTVSNFNELKMQCSENGASKFRVVSDITFTKSIQVEHSIKIIGDDYAFNLEGCSIILNKGVTANIENISFNVGDTAILQQQNTKLNLTNCTFEDCTSSNYNGLGSCIHCNTKIPNLTNPNDFETVLENCTFTNNTSTIFHGGILTINNCNFNATDEDYILMNPDNVAFLYQTDGTASITNSNFNIDIDSWFCEHHANMGKAQCILQCGETAVINGVNYLDLGNDNTLPLFDNEYNNTSHLFAKYYYPKIESCVYSSPLPNYEYKSCCHTVSGVDWVFKDNVQITRADMDSQNENGRD